MRVHLTCWMLHFDSLLFFLVILVWEREKNVLGKGWQKSIINNKDEKLSTRTKKTRKHKYKDRNALRKWRKEIADNDEDKNMLNNYEKVVFTQLKCCITGSVKRVFYVLPCQKVISVKSSDINFILKMRFCLSWNLFLENIKFLLLPEKQKTERSQEIGSIFGNVFGV